MTSTEQSRINCRDREKDLWSAIEDYKAGSLDHPPVQHYIDRLVAVERVDALIEDRANSRRRAT